VFQICDEERQQKIAVPTPTDMQRSIEPFVVQLRELHLFQGIVERKNTITILANVMMEAMTDNTLSRARNCHGSRRRRQTLRPRSR
jgi:hypothetical protein